jgi:hypothetical protein
MKKETIEEAANKIYPNDEYDNETYCDLGELYREKWLEGAKWQQEQDKNKYSEEEVIELLHSRMRYTLGEDYKEMTTIDWFEQYKKK